VDSADIVKGFEYTKGKYVEIDPEELKALQIPTATTMQIKQFVKEVDLSPALFDRPYFVVPKDELHTKALSIMRKALEQTGTLGIGKIAFGGREHLAAIAAPPNTKQKGLMLYMLRFAEELRDPKSALSGVTETKLDTEELTLAKQLIDGKTSSFDLSAYKNDYQVAVKTLVDAKRKGQPLTMPEPEPSKAKIINIMDALRSSIADNRKPKKIEGKRVSRRKRAA
jgi:DNA end-binding protein Ku